MVLPDSGMQKWMLSGLYDTTKAFMQDFDRRKVPDPALYWGISKLHHPRCPYRNESSVWWAGVNVDDKKFARRNSNSQNQGADSNSITSGKSRKNNDARKKDEPYDNSQKKDEPYNNSQKNDDKDDPYKDLIFYLVEPGGLGTGNDSYIKQMIRRMEGRKRVFCVLMKPGIVDKLNGRGMVHFANSMYTRDCADMLKQRFGARVKIALFGFSIGGLNIFKTMSEISKSNTEIKTKRSAKLAAGGPSDGHTPNGLPSDGEGTNGIRRLLRSDVKTEKIEMGRETGATSPSRNASSIANPSPSTANHGNRAHQTDFESRFSVTQNPNAELARIHRPGRPFEESFQDENQETLEFAAVVVVDFPIDLMGIFRSFWRNRLYRLDIFFAWVYWERLRSYVKTIMRPSLANTLISQVESLTILKSSRRKRNSGRGLQNDKKGSKEHEIAVKKEITGMTGYQYLMEQGRVLVGMNRIEFDDSFRIGIDDVFNVCGRSMSETGVASAIALAAPPIALKNPLQFPPVDSKDKRFSNNGSSEGSSYRLRQSPDSSHPDLNKIVELKKEEQRKNLNTRRKLFDLPNELDSPVPANMLVIYSANDPIITPGFRYMEVCKHHFNKTRPAATKLPSPTAVPALRGVSRLQSNIWECQRGGHCGSFLHYPDLSYVVDDWVCERFGIKQDIVSRL